MEKISKSLCDLDLDRTMPNVELVRAIFIILPYVKVSNGLTHYYSCGLSTATIEYSCLSVCLSVCVSVFLSVCVCVCVHDNSKNNGSIHLKLEHIVVYENSSDEFDIGHCPIKVKVTA